MRYWNPRAAQITHKPTGIVVVCEADRSQHKNKAIGLKILKAKLWAKENLDMTKKDDIIRSYWLKEDHFSV